MVAPVGIIPTLALAPTTQVLIWVGVLIVVVAVGGGVLLAYRRRILDKGTQDQAGLLDSLRAMRDSGQITPDEFDAARKRMAARVAGVAPPPSAASRPLPADPAVRKAHPGFDLTGAPLPRPTEGQGPDKSAGPPSNGGPG